MCWKRLSDPCLQSFVLEDRGSTNDDNTENNGFIYIVWTTAYLSHIEPSFYTLFWDECLVSNCYFNKHLEFEWQLFWCVRY